MQEKTTILAMDLGTSNTCIASCPELSPSHEDGIPKVRVIKPQQWHNPTLGGAIPTLILYKDDVPFLIGAAAEYEFGEASHSERLSYSLHSQFKPDIAVNQEANRYMVDFLQLLSLRVPELEGAEQVLVGIPSQAENHYQQILRQCLHSTGWKNAHFLREPVGALLHYIANGALPPSQAAKGVLTVDFGGGTCDFAYLRRADVVGRHGDMLYGGRLFDDLLYQVLLEHNPRLMQQLERENNEYYVHWVACRRAKEEFSAAMAENREQSLTVRVRWSYFDGRKSQECSAYIENFTWADFLQRAGNYTPTPSFLASLQEHGLRSGLSARGEGLLAGKRVDLISWFEDSFLETLKSVRQESAQDQSYTNMPMVLLTGGSSAWPFVQDIIRQNLGTDVKILMGDEPYADIAKGLAQYHILAAHLRQGREALKKELASFMAERIRRHAIERILENGSQVLMQDMGTFLRDVILMPEFRRYRQHGGALSTLMDGIAKNLVQEEARVQQVLDTAMARMGRQIVDACRLELKNWFHEKGIPIVPERLEQTWLAVDMDSFVTHMGEELGKNTLNQGRNAAELATMVAGPGLAALAASGAPITATVIGVSGLVLMKVFNLNKWVVDQVLHVPTPSFIRQKLFSEARLEKLCNEQLEAFGAEFKKHILQSWKKSEGQIMAEAGRVAEEEILALDILNITPN